MFFCWGALAAWLAGNIEGLALDFFGNLWRHVVVLGVSVFIVVPPSVEEFLRMAGLFALADRVREPRADQYRWPVFAFGLGFAALEGVRHWMGMSHVRAEMALVLIAPLV